MGRPRPGLGWAVLGLWGRGRPSLPASPPADLDPEPELKHVSLVLTNRAGFCAVPEGGSAPPACLLAHSPAGKAICSPGAVLRPTRDSRAGLGSEILRATILLLVLFGGWYWRVNSSPQTSLFPSLSSVVRTPGLS